MSGLWRAGEGESGPDPALDRAARVAARAVQAPFALVTLIDAERGTRVGSAGCRVDQTEVGENLTLKCLLLIAAFDQRAAASITLEVPSQQPSDSLHHLAIPLCAADEAPVGVLCVGDWQPREWAREAADVLQDIAALVLPEIALRRERDERRAIEARLERAERLKEQFASALRHEFGQPLTVIQGFSELMSGGDLTPEEIREFAVEINKEALHLSEIVAQIRDMEERVERFAASRRAG